MSKLRFEVLGPIRAWHDDAELDLGSPQQRAVLAVLLLSAGWQVSIDGLIDAVWGQDPPPAAQGTVRTYISRLRRSLSAVTGQRAQDLIQSIGHGYALVPGAVTSDLDLFTRYVHDAEQARHGHDPVLAASLLSQALALWRGMPLAGVSGPYAGSQRARLSELRMAATEDRLALGIDAGGHLAAAAELQMLVDQHPLREKLVELLMLALYRSGRQADALAVFDGARRVLRDELGIDPGPGLRELHERILRADRDLAGAGQAPAGPHRTGPHPGRPLAPLPPDLADFTGRSAALGGIARALRDSAAPVITIAGMPGIGKTALAVRAAHAALAGFPAGQLFGDVAHLRELIADGRAALAGRRLLVVVDDVRDAAQIRSLLPALSGCAVICTTQRRMIDLPGARWFEIGRLGADEALSLLQRLIGPERVAAERDAASLLVATCACQPLAIRTAAARLVARPGWRIGAMVRALQEELDQPVINHPDCELVEAPFDLAHGRLAPDQAFLFRQAALADTADVSVADVAALTGVPEHQAFARLEALADVHLLEAGEYGCYRYDPLVKVYARHKALAEDGVRACLVARDRLGGLAPLTSVPPWLSEIGAPQPA